jgi:hypothetical protein
MPKYLIEASYTLEGVKGLQSAAGPAGARPSQESPRAWEASSRASTSPSATMTPT